MTAVAGPLQDPEQRRRPRVFGLTWVMFAMLLMLVVSEYRFTGGRGQEAALSGEADARGIIEVAVYGLVAAVLLAYVARPPKGVRMPSLLIARWGFTLAMVFVAFWSPFPRLAIARAVQLIIVTWLSQLIANEADAEQLWRATHGFIALVAVSVVSGIVFPFPALYGAQNRFTWLLLHPNISGAYMAIASVICIAALLLRRQRSPHLIWPQWVYLGAFALIFAGLLASRSRGSLAAALVGIGVVLWSASRRRSRLDLALVSGCFFGCLWLLASGDIAAWLARGETSEQLSSLNSRTDIWGQGWELFLQRPMFGHGFVSARGVFLENFSLGGAHNAFVEVLVNSGVFGIFWWLALLFLAVRGAARLGAMRFPDGPLLLGVVMTLIVNGLTDGGLGQGATVHGVWLAVAVGWIVAANRWREEATPVERPRWARKVTGEDDAGRWIGPVDDTAIRRPPAL